MRRYELTECKWWVIAPLLPNKPRGVPRVDDRIVLNGIFWVLRSGVPGAICRSATAPYDLLQPVRTLAQGRRLGSA